MNIAIITTAKTDEEARELLKLMRPVRHQSIREERHNGLRNL